MENHERRGDSSQGVREGAKGGEGGKDGLESELGSCGEFANEQVFGGFGRAVRASGSQPTSALEVTSQAANGSKHMGSDSRRSNVDAGSGSQNLR